MHDDFASDAFVAGDIDHIDAGRKGTHTEMGVGTADHLAGRVVDGYFLVLGVDDLSAVKRDRAAVSILSFVFGVNIGFSLMKDTKNRRKLNPPVHFFILSDS